MTTGCRCSVCCRINKWGQTFCPAALQENFGSFTANDLYKTVFQSHCRTTQTTVMNQRNSEFRQHLPVPHSKNFRHLKWDLKWPGGVEYSSTRRTDCVKMAALLFFIRVNPHTAAASSCCVSVVSQTLVPAFALIIGALILHLCFLLFYLWPLGLFISLLPYSDSRPPPAITAITLSH